ncbi:hypothetical protein GCM10023093_11830 [Nemorincola caseinilytica]|uniref:Proton-coupled thiamine transporter YuaJ n=1 Tax=Nemorincola caseinilytica TaxID=2054315 RepID=A0ABP8N969_9BACT
MKRNNTDLLIAFSLIFISAISRIVNAEMALPNFVPIAAISLFSGAILREKRSMAFLVPIMGQFLADAYFQFFTYIPGFYGVVDQLFTYAGIVGATSLGLFMKQKPLSILGFTLGASATFFLVSNFGYFARGWNGYNMQGFIKTYVDAIPFYKNSFIADMVGMVVLFGGHAIIGRKLAAHASKVRA